MMDPAELQKLRHANAERMRRALIDGSEVVESLVGPNDTVMAPAITQLWEQTRAMLDRANLPFGTPGLLGNVP